MMKKLIYSISLFLLILTTSVHIKSKLSGPVLFEDKFDYPDGKIPEIYWTEGSSRVSIKDKRLYVNSTPDENPLEYEHSTVWLNKVFEGNVHIEFDAHVISAPKDENNINFFLFYKDPSGKSLHSTRSLRKNGAYKHYHSLNGYIFTYLANGVPDTARFRFRDNPGFHLVEESKGYECRAGKTYHIEIKKVDNHIQFLVDGKVHLNVTDDQFNAVHQEGLIGFRTWRTELWFDNLKVSR